MPAAKRSTGALALPLERSFIDTNLLIYADSADESRKQRIAIDVLRHLHGSRLGVLTTQVLNEYCNVALNKLRRTHADVRAQLGFFRQFEIINLTPDQVDMAVDFHQAKSLSYFDALILAGAQLAGCSLLYSEVMQSGEVIGGVMIVNPFVVGQ